MRYGWWEYKVWAMSIYLRAFVCHFLSKISHTICHFLLTTALVYVEEALFVVIFFFLKSPRFFVHSLLYLSFFLFYLILFCRVQVNPTKLSLCFVPFRMWIVLKHPLPLKIFLFRSVYSARHTYVWNSGIEDSFSFHFLFFFLLLYIYELNSANSFASERYMLFDTQENYVTVCKQIS